MKRILLILFIAVITALLVIITVNIYAQIPMPLNEENNIVEESDNVDELKVNIIINSNNYTAKLYDNDTSKKLIEMLPLNITMNELNNNEKYYNFNDSFPINEKKVNYINKGDIMLFGDNCLVIFYDSFKTPYKYTKIGKIENTNNLEKDMGNKDISITITK